MKQEIPAWAMKAAGPEDLDAARSAHRRGTLRIRWPDRQALRDWARHRGWPVPWLAFETAFVTKMLEDQASFELALADSGFEAQIPRKDCTIPVDKLRELDAQYEDRSADGRPVSWGLLVEELREIRRAVEAGVAVTIEGGPVFHTWNGFYTWAHGRYHMLEDGYDQWIGTD
jgi:hypothetical protein